MKRSHLYRLMAIVVLFALLLPFVVFGQGDRIAESSPEIIEVPMPAPSTPLQLGQTIQLEGDSERAAENQVSQGESIPATDLTGVNEVGTLGVSMEPEEELSPSAEPFQYENPNQADACYTYIANGGFDSNQASWSWLGDVQYVQGGYGTRALYMSTTNRKDAYLYQKVTLPAQAQSVYVKFSTYQLLDPGETLYVQVNNAANSQVLTYATGIAVQDSWQQLTWSLPTNQFLGQTVNLVFYLKNDGDGKHSRLWLDNVEFVACNTVVAPPANTRKIDLDISFYRYVPQNERSKYQDIARYAADAIYEMSEGRHYLGKITFYQNNQNYRNVHVLWHQCWHPSAVLSGYWEPEEYDTYYKTYKKLNMGDIFPRTDSQGRPLCNDPWGYAFENLKSTGYTLAHELGHYYYGLFDEYNYPLNNSWGLLPNSQRIQWSVMSNQHCAATPQLGPPSCPLQNASYYLYWLNFSHDENFETNPYHKFNSQYYYYKANAWDTLIRSSDPPQSWLGNKPRRKLYPELAQVAPRPGGNTNGWPTIQISGANPHHPEAGRYFSYQWVPPSLRNDEPIYSASVAAEAGSTITYPQPALLVAHLSRQGLTVAQAGLAVQVTAPNGTQSTLVLKDDGVAPDYLINDGQYAGILPYNQNGEYVVKATFNNSSGQAAFTNVGQMDIPWTLGSPVGESFNLTAETKITVTGYTSDDHTDQFTNPTIVYSDNQPKRGQIDRAGDKDVFKSTLMGDGKYILRLTSLALGIHPRLRLLQSDGQTLIGDWTIIPEEGYYYYIVLEGPAGASFFTEISHANPNAMQGMYEVSFGAPVAGESVGEDEFIIFLPGTIR